jgi:hypothetical protein
LLETEDESLVETEVGLIETEDDSSIETKDGRLFGTEDGWLGTEGEDLLEGVDGLLTRVNAPTEEVEVEHCKVEHAGLLDNVGVAGLDEGALNFEAGLGQA